MSGLSMHRIGTWCAVSAQVILNWIRTFAYEHDEKPKPDGPVVIVELDEMWHHVKKNRTNFGVGKRWMP
jgi:hypothetical protein